MLTLLLIQTVGIVGDSWSKVGLILSIHEILSCRKMLLQSEHNDLALAAETHLKCKYNVKMVYGTRSERICLC